VSASDAGLEILNSVLKHTLNEQHLFLSRVP
jgi:hypothetical protein